MQQGPTTRQLKVHVIGLTHLRPAGGLSGLSNSNLPMPERAPDSAAVVVLVAVPAGAVLPLAASVLGGVVVLGAPDSGFFGAAVLSFFGAASSFLSVVAGLPACSVLDSLHIARQQR